MLVLSRKIGEKLLIGDNVTVTITRISGNRVTLGITAPNDVRVVRGELQVFEEEESHSAPLPITTVTSSLPTVIEFAI